MKSRILTLLACWFMSLISIEAAAQIHAAFTSNTTSGCSPLVVNFTDQSTGTPTNWLWDFGNGNTSVQQSPSAAYLAPGTYSVKLVVKNAGGKDSITKTNFITVFFPPTAAVRLSDTVGCTPMAINFTDLSVAGSAAITSWTWDFGDGTTSNTHNPSHTYTNPGLYTIVLLVRDANGCTDRITLTDYVRIKLSPTANFTAAPTTSCGAPRNVTFTNTSIGSGNTYTWNFGDGTTSTATSPTHTYTATGTYTVSLTARASNGCTNTKTRTSYINIINYQASFTVNQTIACVGSPFTFTDHSTPSPVSWHWDFGNGMTSNSQNPSISYATNNLYTVTLISTGASGCSDTTTMVVRVLPPPEPAITADSTSSCHIPFAVNFTGNPAGLSSYVWDFGDGTTGTGRNPHHVYTTPGLYSVTLTATDASGCSTTVVRNNYINIQLPIADFTADVRTGCAPLTVHFTDLSTSNNTITAWHWDFGDGTTSNNHNPTHTYTVGGLYTVTLTITTASGCTVTIVKNQYIRVGEPPIVQFTATPRSTCAYIPVQFTDQSNSGNSWLWFFGDGGTSTLQNPLYHYGDTGIFTVALIVGNNGCFDTLIKPNYIHIYPPIAHFNFSTTCATPFTVPFNNTSIGGNYFNWTFGDGDTSNLFSPTHTYAGRGTYSIRLYVLDTVTGCYDSTTSSVTLTKPVADFSANHLTGCNPLSTKFTSSSIDAVSYKWSFGDGSTSNSFSPTHTYHTPGQFTVRLIVTDIHGCKDTMIKPNYITVYDAYAGIIASNTTGCTPLSVAYTDSSSAFMGTIVVWSWNLGNGTTSTLQNPSSIYTIPGNYTVSLAVTDNHGCTDSIAKINFIVPTYPTPAFTAAPRDICVGRSVQFTDQSIGTSLHYNWNFGDGNSSTSQNPLHVYADTGYYTVSLHVQDINHCDSAISKINYIHVIKPHADFHVDTLFARCPPLTVNFTDLSSDSITAWVYNFGDGQTSTLETPSHIYTRPGVYHPWMIATNYLGCSDTMFYPDSIVIGGPVGTFDFIQPSVCIPFDVTFFAHTTNGIASYVWDFADGNVNVDDDTTDHVYNRAGIFYPVLIIRDSVGCTQSIPTPRPIVATSVHSNFNALPPQLCSFGNVAFIDSSSAIPGLSAWHWSFGDGGISTQQNPTHYYTAPGIYSVSLVAVNDSGCTDTMLKPSLVKIYPAPHASFVPNDSIICFGNIVTLTNQSTSDSTIATYNWNFGDGTTSTLANPNHNYLVPGTYTVRLTIATVNGCSDSVQHSIVVNRLPVVTTSNDTVICRGFSVGLNATGGTSYLWSPSTGLSNANISNPNAQPTITTKYSVLVTDINGCQTTDSILVTVNPLPVVTTSPDTTVCPGQSARLSATGGVSFAWSPATGLNNANIANPVATILSNTTYTVTVTDGNGCQNTGISAVNLYAPSTPTVSPDPTICIGQNTQLTASGGITYAWSPSTALSNATIANPIASPTSTTLYKVFLTDVHGCRANDSILVHVNPLPVVTTSPDAIICTGFSANLTATGGTTYLWSPSTGLNNANIANPVSTTTTTITYHVSVTDNNGCQANDSVKVTVNALPVVTTSPDTTVCPGQSARLSATGGVSYSWSPATGLNNANIANPIATVLSNTTYTVTVTDINGCQNTGTSTVNLYTPPVPTVSPDPTICIGQNAQLTASGGITYAWSPSTALSNATIANPIASPTSTILYRVFMTDTHGCHANDSLIVHVNPLPVVTTSPDAIICTGFSANLNATGGATYLWTPPTGLNNANIANPVSTTTITTTYHVLVTDNNGCQANDSVKVTVNALPVVTTSPDTTVCPGQSARLSATGGVSFAWSPATGLSNANIANPVATVLSNTTYTVTVTDGNGCQNTGTSTVNLYTPPVPTVSPDPTICVGHTAQIFVTGGVSYIWSPATTLNSAVIDSPVATTTSTTIYHVMITDIHGCKANDSVTVHVNPLPVVTTSPDAIICNGSSANLNATGGTTYLWTPSTALDNAIISNPISTTTITTTYLVLVTDNNGCQASDSVKVTVNILPVVTSSPDTTVCPGQSVRLSANGGVSYAWSPATGLSNANIANPIATILSNTTYTVTVTDSHGCQNITTSNINLYALPVPVVSPDPTICLGQSAQISASGGVSYIWSPATTLNSAVIDSPVATTTSTTIYHVMITDIHGCKANDSVTVHVNPLPVVTTSPDAIICNGSSANLNATGGTTYLWTPSTALDNAIISNPISTTTITTTYLVLVTDNNGCQASDSVKVTVNILPVVTSSPDTTVCPGQSVRLSANGGVSYAWSPATGLSNANIANPIATILSNTTYTVTVTDSHGCQNITTSNINLYALPVPVVSPDPTICLGQSAQISASGGVSYTWSPSTALNNPMIANPMASPTSTTLYHVLVTDVHGCKANDTVTVHVNPLPIVTTSPDAIICTGVSANLNATGGAAYLWSPSSDLNNANISNPVSTPTVTTTYHVLVTDINGCQNTDSVKVTVNSLPVITMSHDTSVCPGQSARLSASGGTTYVWSPATGLSNPNIANPIANVLSNTTYTVTVTDSNGCQNTGNSSVNLYTPPTPTVSPDPTICIGHSAQIFATGGISYTWSPSVTLNSAVIDSPMATPTSSTVYHVILTDVHGCKANDSVTVHVNPLPVVTASPDAIICTGFSANLSATGGTNYLWNPATDLNDANISNPISTTTVTTTYHVIVTDNNGCQNTDSVKVTVNALPVPVIDADTSICAGTSVTLHISGGVQYLWSPANTLSCATCNSPVATPATATTYTVQVTNAQGCVATDSIHVGLYHVTAAIQLSDSAACMFTNLAMTDLSTADGGVNSWLWNFGDGDTSHQQNTQHTYHQHGQYPISLTVVSAHGCVATTTAPFTAYLLPAINGGGNHTICRNDSVLLQAIGGVSYQWNPSTGLDDANSPHPMASPDSTTTYVLTGTSNAGCVSTDTIKITVNQLPHASVIGTGHVCYNDSVQFIASGGVQYLWNPSTGLSDSTIANPKASPHRTTGYTVVVTDSNGCKSDTSIGLFVYAQILPNLSPDTAICYGNSVALTATGAASYHWTPATGLSCDTCSNTTATPIVTTTYKVAFTSTDGCTIYDSITVTVNPLPVISGSPDTAICEGQEVSLIVTGGSTYEWLNNNGLNCDTCSKVLASPAFSQTYIVVVTTNAGCTGNDTINVAVHHIHAALTVSDTVVCNPAQITWLDNSIADTTIVSRLWNLGDGQIDSMVQVHHNYLQSGNYVSTLTVKSAAGCIDSIQQPFTILLTPVAVGGPDISICYGDTAQLYGAGTGKYTWSSGTTLNDSTLNNPISYTTVTTSYILTITSNSGCYSSDTVVVTVNPLPAVHASGNQTGCYGDTLQLHATGGDTYLWQPSAGLNDSTSANPWYGADSSQRYTVTATNLFGCKKSDSITVTVNPIPTMVIKGTSAICKGDTTTLSGVSNGTLLWQPSTGLSCTTCPNPVASPDTTTQYTLVVTNSYLCSAKDTHTVYVNPLPNVHTTGSTTICKGMDYELYTTATNATQYIWMPSAGLDDSTKLSPLAHPLGTTHYTIIATSEFGCKASDTVTLFVIDRVPMLISADTTVCAGSELTLYASATGIGTEPGYVVWSSTNPMQDVHSGTQEITPEQSGIYTVIGYSGNCAPDTQNIRITVNPLPTVNLGNDMTVFMNEPITLHATSTGAITGYAWRPLDTLTCATCPNIHVTAHESMEYAVTVIDTNGCTASDRLKVHILTSCEDDIFVPNTFTPNNDGVNDKLYVRGVHLTGIKVFRIFDRWGNLVFETSDINRGWDGTYKGTMVNPGVFVYYVEAICGNGGDALKKGNVTLLK